MGTYDIKPERFLERLHEELEGIPGSALYCAGFELEQWRCNQFAFHLAEWLPDYALPEDELRVHHGNSFTKLNQAAVRVYTSEKYKNRGEAGEIALHAICRDFFETIPISPRVFYKSASNDVVKAFDMVHVRFPNNKDLEIWLGESKLYKSASEAITDAISSIKQHIDAGFLSNEKLLLGPQIPKTTPNYEAISSLFKTQTSLDKLIGAAVFVVGILCNSKSAAQARKIDPEYASGVQREMLLLSEKLKTSGLTDKLRLVLVYIPLADKDKFVAAFDKRLKGLQ